MASEWSASLNGGLGAEPPAESSGSVGSRGRASDGAEGAKHP